MDIVLHCNDGDEVEMPDWSAYALQPGWLLLYDNDGGIELIPSERIEAVKVSGFEGRVA